MHSNIIIVASVLKAGLHLNIVFQSLNVDLSFTDISFAEIPPLITQSYVVDIL